MVSWGTPLASPQGCEAHLSTLLFIQSLKKSLLETTSPSVSCILNFSPASPTSSANRGSFTTQQFATNISPSLIHSPFPSSLPDPTPASAAPLACWCSVQQTVLIAAFNRHLASLPVFSSFNLSSSFNPSSLFNITGLQTHMKHITNNLSPGVLVPSQKLKQQKAKLQPKLYQKIFV